MGMDPIAGRQETNITVIIWMVSNMEGEDRFSLMGTGMLAHLRKGFITVKEFLVSAMGLNTRGIIVTDCVKEKVLSNLPMETCTKARLSQECQKAKAFINFRE